LSIQTWISGHRISRIPFSSPLRRLVFPVLLFLSFVLSSCAVEAPAYRTIPSALDIRGEGSRIIWDEWWFTFWLSTIIFVGIMILLGYIIYRRRRSPTDLSSSLAVDMGDPGGMHWIWLGGIALPVVVLSAVLAMSMRSSILLASPPSEEVVTIDVIGHRWWWEVRYPEQGIVTANQIHVPVGQPVRIRVTSADVIHSFWVPQVHPKIDLIPGQVNSIWLQADVPGVYRGICAEFCGLQHARMHLMLVAEAPERFHDWLTHEQGIANIPDDPAVLAGQQVFESSSCVYCHTIRGTSAAGSVGPDLTHFGRRLTIAAGVLENNPGNLGGWILDPQHVKPGSLMPSTSLTGAELQALLAYLSALR
jgi:cytochrome c oxidase subunit II